MPYQWTIYQADLDPTIGREQAGERPVLVVSAEALNAHYAVVTVVPITSRKEGRPAHLGEILLSANTGGLPRESFALCYQARVLDKSRLGRVYGVIGEESVRQAVREMLAVCLDL